MNKICVYAICKNESKFVDKWVESMKEADSIVVLDTGSTDDTVEQLKKYDFVTVDVKEITPWRFDVARNEAMKLAPDDCNILISTDLDEVLEPGWADILREKWIDGFHTRASYKYSWSHLDNGESGRVFRYNKIHSREWVWKYPVHELLFNPNTNTNLYSINNSLELFDEIHLHHYPDQTKSRGTYLPLLELRAEEDPDDYYGLIYLAHEYFYRNMYDKSIRTFNKILSKFHKRCTDLEIASCYLFAGDCYVADVSDENHLTHAIQSYQMAISIEPTYREPYINLAKVFLTLKDYDQAIFYLKTSLKKSYRHYTWLERDKSWTYELWLNLSLAEFYSGNKKDSLVHAMKAVTYEPENQTLKDNVDIILKMSSDIDLIS